MDRTKWQSLEVTGRPLPDDADVDRPANGHAPAERTSVEQVIPDRTRQEWARQELALPSRRLPECEMPEHAIGEAAQPARAVVVTAPGRTASDTVPIERALPLAESILALDEPWRARFLDLILCYAGVEVSGTEVTPEQLAGWLADADLYERISLMLRAWTTSK